MKRKQFTFYSSFLDAIECSKSVRERAMIYDAISHYGIYGKIPDWDSLPPQVRAVVLLCLPVLASGYKKAVLMKKNDVDEQGSNRGQTPFEQKEKEIELENELEIETESETEGDGLGRGEDFQRFWDLYPKKSNRMRALEAFQEVQVPIQVLLDALGKQRRSHQWNRENGRFIPQPATWLKERRWEDQLPAPVPKGASGELGESEMAAIRQMLAWGQAQEKE